jgi:hypothetical protein
MYTEQIRERVTMKGCPSSIVVQDHGNVSYGENGATVQIWISSPTGDSSDSLVYNIPCLTITQARTIARQWVSVWGIPQND